MFNQEILNEVYKNIQITLLKDGVPIPYLVNETVPFEFRLNRLELSKIGNQLSNDVLENLRDNYYNRRLNEKKLWDSTNSVSERKRLFQEYKEFELKEFIDNYPEFKNIII